MIAFKIEGQELDLSQDTSVQVEYYSSLFETDRIPGMFTYPFTLPLSRKNKRLLGFPGILSVRNYRKEPFDCQMYLGNLWRIGKLFVLGTSEKGISVNFQSDVGDLSEPMKNDRLRDLDLGSEPLVMQVQDIYPAANYALFPVKNIAFFKPGIEGLTYNGYINYYENGFFVPSWQYPAVPFPYLVHILRRVMACYGYTITGEWIASEDARRLVIYNTRSIFQEEEVTYSQHLPDMKANDFLKAIRAALCLGFIFNTTTKTLEIVRLEQVILDTAYTDWRQRHLQVEEWNPNDTDGFRLEFTPDEGDELSKGLPPTAYQVGRGKETIKIGLDTVQVLAHQDQRQWETPIASQEGYAPVLEGSEKFTLRLLSYSGLQPDAQGNLYPGAQALSLEALYEQRHRYWLEFLSETEAIDAEIMLTSTDLRTLRQDKKVLASDGSSTLKALWKKISVTVSQKGISLAKAELMKVRV